MSRRVLAQCLRRLLIQASAQVRALQVAVAVGSSAVQQNGFTTFLGQLRADRGMIEGQMHGIARLGMRRLKVELRGGGQAGAGSPQRDACGGQAA